MTEKTAHAAKSRFLVGALVLAVLLAAMYWPTWRWMWDRWNQKDDYFSHGAFVPVVAVILVLIKQAGLKKAAPGSVPAGLYIIAGSILFHLFGLTFVSMLVGMELYFLGPGKTRVLIWPTLFLVFMIPLPQVSVDFVATQSKFVAAKVSIWAMQQVGYEVVGAGSYVYLPDGKQLVVDEVCSGLKYLFSLVAFGAFYVQLSSLPPMRKILLLALAFPLAWLANVIRILTLCLVAYHWDAVTAVKWYSHDLFGFVMYFLAFILMFLAESALMIGMKSSEPSNTQETLHAGPTA